MHGTPAFICGVLVDFALAALYLPIRCYRSCYLTEVIWRRQTSLLFASILLGACAAQPPAPELPDSVSPGWKLTALTKSPGTPDCWKALYAGSGDAEVNVCWYQATGSAFDAVQRTRAEAQAVKFQEQHYFVLVKWNNVPKANLTALIRAIQKYLQPAS
jgi:hypothetical protein